MGISNSNPEEAEGDAGAGFGVRGGDTRTHARGTLRARSPGGTPPGPGPPRTAGPQTIAAGSRRGKETQGIN